MEGNCSTWGGGGLPEGDVGDGAGAIKHTKANIAAAREASNSFDNIDAARDLKNIGAHGGLSIPSNNNRGFGLVLGTGRPASGSPHNFNGSPVTVARFRFGGRRSSSTGCGDGGGTTAAAAVVFLRSLTFSADLEVMLVVGLLLLLEVVVVVRMERLLEIVGLVKLGEHVIALILAIYIFTLHPSPSVSMIGNLYIYIYIDVCNKKNTKFKERVMGRERERERADAAVEESWICLSVLCIRRERERERARERERRVGGRWVSLETK